MNFSLTVAKRYLISKKSTNVINVISILTGLGMFIGTAILIMILSVFNGFESLVISLYNVFYPDITIEAKVGKSFEMDDAIIQKLRAIKYVDAVSKTITENAIVDYQKKQDVATLKGVDSSYYGVVKDLGKHIVMGNKTLKINDKEFAIVGAGIANKLAINPENPFEYLAIFMPGNKNTYLNSFQNPFNRELVFPGGIFSFQQEFDGKYIIVPISLTQKLLGNYTHVTALELSLKKGASTEKVRKEIQKIVGSKYNVVPKIEQNKTLYKIMRTEKWVAFFIIGFVLLIISFNIIGALSMLVIEKKKDVYTLIALGASEKIIRNIFLLEGILLSVGGGLLGMLFAFLVCIIQEIFGIVPMPGDSFLIHSYPVEMRAIDFLSVFVLIVILSVLASWLPAVRASKQKISING